MRVLYLLRHGNITALGRLKQDKSLMRNARAHLTSFLRHTEIVRNRSLNDCADLCLVSSFEVQKIVGPVIRKKNIITPWGTLTSFFQSCYRKSRNCRPCLREEIEKTENFKKDKRMDGRTDGHLDPFSKINSEK